MRVKIADICEQSWPQNGHHMRVLGLLGWSKYWVQGWVTYCKKDYNPFVPPYNWIKIFLMRKNSLDRKDVRKIRLEIYYL
jgi:hypothetical protein